MVIGRFQYQSPVREVFSLIEKKQLFAMNPAQDILFVLPFTFVYSSILSFHLCYPCKSGGPLAWDKILRSLGPMLNR